MPRNSSGTYTLPAGNPVVSGTLIEASWANTTLSDLASAMTESLSRDGEGGMTAALRLYDGTVSLPGLAFSNETSSGLYRAGTADVRMSITGADVAQFLATGMAVTGTLSASGNFAINTDKFTVAASSGNTAVAGTLAVTGASTFSGQTNTFENSTAYYPQLINRNKTNDANGSYISLQKIRSTSVVQNGDVLGNVIFSGYDGAAYLQGAYINAVVSATPGTNDMPTDLAFGTTADGGSGPTERMRITKAGRVGVGTSSPLANFQVKTATNVNAAFTTSGIDATGAQLYGFNDAGDSLIPLWTNGSYLGFATGNTERMRLDASGNLGLGVTPSAWGSSFKAYQVGRASLYTYTGGNASVVASNVYHDGTNPRYIASDYAGSYVISSSNHAWNVAGTGTAGNAITFTQAMTLDANGRLGIGETSPAYKLVVKGSSSGENILNVSNSAGGSDGGATNVIRFSCNGNNNWANARYDAYVHSWNVDNTERARLDLAGFLLIGYTSSNGGYKLQVNSQIFATSSTIATSDARYKENIVTLDGALDIVNALRPVQFSWKEHPVHAFDTATPTVGFLAQEVQQVLADKPYLNSIVKANECVIEPEEKDEEGNVTKAAVTEEFFGIAEGNMISILTAAIKEQQQIIQSLTERITALEGAAQ